MVIGSETSAISESGKVLPIIDPWFSYVLGFLIVPLCSLYMDRQVYNSLDIFFMLDMDNILGNEHVK